MSAGPIVRICLPAVLLLGMALPADAQLRGLTGRLKERAASVLAREVEQARSPSGPIHNENVLMMTPAVLDRFALALAAERAKRDEVAPLIQALPERRAEQAAALSARYESRTEWQACSREVRERPEYTRRLEEYRQQAAGIAEAVAAGRMTLEAAARTGQEITAAVTALSGEAFAKVVDTCGPEPSAGGGPSAGSLPTDSDLRAQPLRAALEAGGFTAAQYSILKERVVPFCAAAGSAAPEGEVHIPGFGGKFYVYAGAEAEALAPRCAELSRSLEAVL